MLKSIARAFILAAVIASSAVFAQAWPIKPVRILVGTGAGGVTDIVTRSVAAELTKWLGQPFLVENRTGANSSIAAAAVKNAPPDGYLIYSGPATPFSSLYLKENNMDATKELQPVTVLAIGESYVIVRADLGVSNLKEFAAKAKATRLKHASPAPPMHSLMAAIAKPMGFTYDNIPFKTTDQAMVAVLSGDCDFIVKALPGSLPGIRSGKLKVIANTGPKRSPLMPEVPTAKEQGVDVAVTFSLAFWAPLGTPKDIVAKLNTTTAEVLKAPGVGEKFHSFAMIPTSSTPEELVRMSLYELAFYRDANALIGLNPE